MSFKCPRCFRRLQEGAKSCICGWSEVAAAPVSYVDYGALERERARLRRWEEAGSPSAAESISKIRALLATRRPSPREHWEGVLRTPNAPRLAIEHARAALRRSSEEPMEQTMREPGSDDEPIQERVA